MNKVTAFTSGIFVSIISYATMIIFYGNHAEPWDYETLYYIGVFFPTVVAFAIALGTRFIFALLFLAVC